MRQQPHGAPTAGSRYMSESKFISKSMPANQYQKQPLQSKAALAARLCEATTKLSITLGTPLSPAGKAEMGTSANDEGS